MNTKFLRLPSFNLQTVQFAFTPLFVLYQVLKGLENETLRSSAGGTVYSLFNSDWTVRFEYVIDSVYHKLFNLYILL